MIRFVCEHCGRHLGARDDLAGKAVRCPGCSQPAPVPAVIQLEEVPAVPVVIPEGEAAETEDDTAPVEVLPSGEEEGAAPEPETVPPEPAPARSGWVLACLGTAVGAVLVLGFVACLGGIGYFVLGLEPPRLPVADNDAKPAADNPVPRPAEARPPQAVGPAPPVAVPRQGGQVITREARRLQAGPRRLRCVACLSDGRVVSGGDDGAVRIWDLTSGQQVRELKSGALPILALAVSADGRRAVTGGWDHEARVWDLDAGTQLVSFDRHTDLVASVALSPDGRRALSCHCEFPNGRGKVWLWDTATGKEVAGLDGSPTSAVYRATFYPDGRQVLVMRGRGFQQQASCWLWDPDGGDLRQVFAAPQDPNTHEFGGTALSAAGDRLLLRFGNSLLLADAHTGGLVRRIEVPTLTRMAVAFSPDGHLGLCAGGGSSGGRPVDNFIHVFDLQTGQEVCRFQAPGAIFEAAVFTPDGRHILSAANNALLLWDLPAR
jgi:WD40 repeat protein